MANNKKQKLPDHIRVIGRKFWVDKTIDGTRYRKGFPHLTAALDHLQKLQMKALRGLLEKEPPALTIDEWVTDCLLWAENEKAESTCVNYKYVLTRFTAYLKKQGLRTLSEIKVAHLEGYKQSRLSTPTTRTKGARIAPGTVNWELKHISAGMSRAVRLGQLESNPCKKVPKVKTVRKMPEVLTRGEVAAILETASSHDQPLFALLYYTGMRIGEALHLDWDDIDLGAGTIKIRPKKGWSPKSKRGRVVPIHPELQPWLSGTPRLHSRVFCLAKGKPRTYGGVKANFSRLCESLGIRKGGLHVFRHTCATHVVQASKDVKAVQDLLGHSNITQTMVYTHLDPENVRESVAMLPAIAPELSKEMSKPRRQRRRRPRKPNPGGALKGMGAAGIEPATSTV